MTKLRALLAALLLALLPAAGYAAELPEPASDTPLYAQPACIPLNQFMAPQSGAPFSIAGDAGVVVGDNWYPVYRDFTALKAALGEPLEVITDADAAEAAPDKEYRYEFGSVFTHPVEDIEVWYEIFVDGGGVTTSRGIKIGAAPDEVLAAYGDEYYADSPTVYVYSISGREQDYATPAVTIEAINNGVIYFDVYYPVFYN